VDAGDAHHEESLCLLRDHPGPVHVPSLVVAEVAHLIGSRLGPGAEVRFVGDLASGALLAEPVAAGDWLRIAQLVWRYRDLSLGTVDASVVAAAERLGIRAIATFDRRHFAAVRPAHAAAFELVP
jgi:predicted nucleic acid-binding protein